MDNISEADENSDEQKREALCLHRVFIPVGRGTVNSKPKNEKHHYMLLSCYHGNQGKITESHEKLRVYSNETRTPIIQSHVFVYLVICFVSKKRTFTKI